MSRASRRPSPGCVAGVVLTACLLHAAGGLAFGDSLSEVVPDRPDVANSTQTVPFGAFQVEAGLGYARTRIAASPAERRLSVQATLRAGVTDRLEIRLEGEPLVRLRGAEADTDHGDLALGLKYRFLDSEEGRWWPSLGAQPFVKLPIADAPIGSERPDFGFLALASLELPRQFSLDVNAGLAVVGQTRPNGYLLQALVAASLGRQITERLSSFVELFFASRAKRDGRDILGVGTGLTYLLTRRIALDAGVETSLTGRGPDYAFQAGVCARFGR